MYWSSGSPSIIFRSVPTDSPFFTPVKRPGDDFGVARMPNDAAEDEEDSPRLSGAAS